MTDIYCVSICVAQPSLINVIPRTSSMLRYRLCENLVNNLGGQGLSMNLPARFFASSSTKTKGV